MTSASMLLPSSGPSLNVALTVGPISATGVAWEGCSNSGTAHPLWSIGGRMPPAERTPRPALQALVERAGDGVAGRAHAELGVQAGEPFADRIKARAQLPRELGLALDDGG